MDIPILHSENNTDQSYDVRKISRYLENILGYEKIKKPRKFSQWESFGGVDSYPFLPNKQI